MLLHNLKIAVRNLLKYKVQNAISILCLAVGIICFAVTWHMLKGFWSSQMYQDDPRCVRVTFRDKESKDPKQLAREDYQRLLDAHLPSVDHLDFCQPQYYSCTWFLTDSDGKENYLNGSIFTVSPDYFNYHGFRSAITGKRIPRLEPGTIIMGDHLQKMTMGEEVNPVGWQAHSLESDRFQTITGTIQDVVRSGMSMPFRGLYVVSDNPAIWDERGLYEYLNVMMPADKTRDDLLRELGTLYPDCDIEEVPGNDSVTAFVKKMFVALILFLGSCVLIIGGVGFLKMQLQLFFLRGREMALRRCMGARPWQLFWLLTLEVAIVFLLTAVIAIILSALIASYAVPFIVNLSNGKVFIDVEAIYQYELWIALGTMLLTLLIAAASVRHTLHAPLGMKAGRSCHVSHRGRSLMLVVQYVVCILFMYFILGTAFLVNETANKFSLPENPSHVKQCMLLEPREYNMSLDEIRSLPSAQHVGFLIRLDFLPTESDSVLITSYGSHDNGNILLSASYVSEETFLALGIQPRKEASADLIPVYTLPEDASRLAEVLKAEPCKRESQVLLDGQTYVTLGYAPIMGSSLEESYPSCYIITSKMTQNDVYGIHYNKQITEDYFVMQPKPNCYEQLKEELDGLYHQKLPGTLIHPVILNAYDVWYALARMLEAVQQLCMLLIVVSLLCIIISVYSAVALDTRGREKEVAIRKVHGAKARDIMRLFGSYYVRLIVISTVITAPVGIIIFIMLDRESGMLFEAFFQFCLYLIVSAAIMVVITLATIGQKIWRVARTNPAEVVKKE